MPKNSYLVPALPLRTPATSPAQSQPRLDGPESKFESYLDAEFEDIPEPAPPPMDRRKKSRGWPAQRDPNNGHKLNVEI